MFAIVVLASGLIVLYPVSLEAELNGISTNDGFFAIGGNLMSLVDFRAVLLLRHVDLLCMHEDDDDSQSLVLVVAAISEVSGKSACLLSIIREVRLEARMLIGSGMPEVVETLDVECGLLYLNNR